MVIWWREVGPSNEFSIWIVHAFAKVRKLLYRKNPKISDTPKFAVITLKNEQDGFSLE